MDGLESTVRKTLRKILADRGDPIKPDRGVPYRGPYVVISLAEAVAARDVMDGLEADEEAASRFREKVATAVGADPEWREPLG